MIDAETGRSAAVRADVWFWSLDVDPGERELLLALLSVDERQRADRFARARDRDRWIAAHGRMRQLLGRAVGRAPQDLTFVVGEHGRPELAPRNPPRPAFNLSHADGLGALALSFDGQVGCDIEAVGQVSDEEAFHVLSDAERRAMEPLIGADRQTAFFRFWTLKEAFIKGLGLGLSMPLQDFDISPPGAGPPTLTRLAGVPEGPAQWRLAEAVPAPGYLAGLAVLTHGRDLQVDWRGLRDLEDVPIG